MSRPLSSGKYRLYSRKIDRGKLGFSIERHPDDGNLRHVRLKPR